MAVATVILPPDPDSTAFPVEVVTLIVKDPHAAFVLLGFLNFPYEKVRLVDEVIVDVIAVVSVYEDVEAPESSYMLKQFEEGIVIVTLYPE